MGQFGICRSIFNQEISMNFPQARPQQGEPGMTGGGQDSRSTMNTAGNSAHPQGGGASPIVLNKTSMGAGTSLQQQPPQEHGTFVHQRNGTPSGRPPIAQQGFVDSNTLALA
jgi:hypothetical protein